MTNTHTNDRDSGVNHNPEDCSLTTQYFPNLNVDHLENVVKMRVLTAGRGEGGGLGGGEGERGGAETPHSDRLPRPGYVRLMLRSTLRSEFVNSRTTAPRHKGCTLFSSRFAVDQLEMMGQETEAHGPNLACCLLL